MVNAGVGRFRGLLVVLIQQLWNENVNVNVFAACPVTARRVGNCGLSVSLAKKGFVLTTFVFVPRIAVRE